MFETKKDYDKTEMRTLIELLYGSIAVKEQALSSKIFFWVVSEISKTFFESEDMLAGLDGRFTLVQMTVTHHHNV